MSKRRGLLSDLKAGEQCEPQPERLGQPKSPIAFPKARVRCHREPRGQDAWAAPMRHSSKRSLMRRADAMLRRGTTCIKLK
jgi:hypothetical protein